MDEDHARFSAQVDCLECGATMKLRVNSPAAMLAFLRLWLTHECPAKGKS